MSSCHDNNASDDRRHRTDIDECLHLSKAICAIDNIQNTRNDRLCHDRGALEETQVRLICSCLFPARSAAPATGPT